MYNLSVHEIKDSIYRHTTQQIPFCIRMRLCMLKKNDCKFRVFFPLVRCRNSANQCLPSTTFLCSTISEPDCPNKADQWTGLCDNLCPEKEVWIYIHTGWQNECLLNVDIHCTNYYKQGLLGQHPRVPSGVQRSTYKYWLIDGPTDLVYTSLGARKTGHF